MSYYYIGVITMIKQNAPFVQDSTELLVMI